MCWTPRSRTPSPSALRLGRRPRPSRARSSQARPPFLLPKILQLFESAREISRFTSSTHFCTTWVRGGRGTPWCTLPKKHRSGWQRRSGHGGGATPPQVLRAPLDLGRRWHCHYSGKPETRAVTCRLYYTLYFRYYKDAQACLACLARPSLSRTHCRLLVGQRMLRGELFVYPRVARLG